VKPLSQRNLVGAVIATAAIATLVAIDLWRQWSTYRQTVPPEHVVPVSRSLTADGQTWKLDSVRRLGQAPPTAGQPLPAGTVLTVVTIDRSGAPTGQWCAGVLTDDSRRWRAGGRFAVPLADGATDICGKAGRLQFSFLPGTAVPTAVESPISTAGS
jgi:hypothetical protein